MYKELRKVKAYKNAYKLREIQNDLIEIEDLYIIIDDLLYLYKQIVKEKIYYISRVQTLEVAPCSIEQATKIFYANESYKEITYQDFLNKLFLDIQQEI